MNTRTGCALVLAIGLCGCPSGDSNGAGGGGDSSAGGGSGGAGGGGSGVGGGTSSTGGGTGGGSTIANTGTFPDISSGSNGRYPVLQIDASGTRHLLYQQLLGSSGSSAIPFRYGECTSNCGVASGWQFTNVGDRGLEGGFGHLALNAQGKPRVVFVRAATTSSPHSLWFASCDNNCTQAASWTSGEFKVFGSSEYLYDNTGRNLSVDGTGRVHFVYSLGGLNYLSCASNCTQAASWSAPVKIANFRGRVSVATTATGGVRVAYTTLDDPWLAYRTCEGNCGVLTSWAAETLLRPSEAGQVSLRLDPQGRPRIFFNTNGLGNPTSYMSYYTWCDANCGTSSNWTAVSVGMADGDGRYGLDFAINASGAVTAGFQTTDDKLAIVRCSANCQSGGTWALSVVEDTDTLKSEVSPRLPDCSNFSPPRTPYAYWYPGEQTTVAIHPTSQRLEIAHRTYSLERCGISGNVTEGVMIPRFSGPF